MKTSRTHEPTKQIAPIGPLAWDALLSKAIKRAEAKGDPRLEGLRKAIREGKSESTLRKYGIISEMDLDREFPG
jgi:hypothetical protein